jgi:hypothetical protein
VVDPDFPVLFDDEGLDDDPARTDELELEAEVEGKKTRTTRNQSPYSEPRESLPSATGSHPQPLYSLQSFLQMDKIN